MKIKIFFLFFVLSGVILGQTKVGQVSFMLGTVEYSLDGSTEWKAIDVGTNILSNWVIRGVDDAELEITWENGDVSELSDLKSVKVIDLMKNSNLETDGLDRMKNKIDVMFTENEASKVQGVAGIRRSEVTIEKEDSIYWAEPTPADFSEGYVAFQNADFDKAITVFEQVVLQDPLSKKGEISRSCLITIYTNKNDQPKVDEHTKIFMRDFPESELLQLMEENK
ncbi:MAG: hypothetical protein PF445_02935 [Melioribacteraceae bacterium]|jgi:hypothetical protein|nr:hypothetical protein [Melioribacteraceae bacterium]